MLLQLPTGTAAELAACLRPLAERRAQAEMAVKARLVLRFRSFAQAAGVLEGLAVRAAESQASAEAASAEAVEVFAPLAEAA